MKALCRPQIYLVAIAVAVALHAQTAYFQRVVFDNSLTPNTYFYSAGKASAPSAVELTGGKLPVDKRVFHTPPNALRLAWKSMPQGGWDAEIQLYAWRNRPLFFPGDALSFWCYTSEPIAQLPHLVLKDSQKQFTAPLTIHHGLPARQWTQIKIPFRQFTTASIHPFDPHRTNSVFFIQGSADSTAHTLFIDDVEIVPERTPPVPRTAPRNLTAKGYERHVDLNWNSAPEQSVTIYRSLENGPFEPIGIQAPGVNRFTDFIGKINAHARYRLSPESPPASAATHAMTDDELLTMVQEASFHYYWDGANPISGMARENLPGDDRIIATGASGFGIMALIVGVDRHFITRQQGLDRLLTITHFLAQADRFHGAWPHFMDGATGRRLPVFDMYDNGADLVETGFLMQGLLAARQYFHDKELSTAITSLWQTVEWDWFRRTSDGPALYWHWSPEYSWHIDHPLSGWNEVLIAYLLAIASPTHSVPASLYHSGWGGFPKEFTGPLFFTHYSYMGFDPHHSYFKNLRAMALANHAYCVQKGFPAGVWGITAVDGPNGYVPYEPSPSLDDGTIAPTGAISSFPYTPELSLEALHRFYRDLGPSLWGIYGFRDAFNLKKNWVSGIYMGLNQAPMAVMIENYRTGLVWKSFMANPEIARMLRSVRLIS
jgi:exo beta-1,2-glucooligosaccharide sophorohydrolase (non-reducing end)